MDEAASGAWRFLTSFGDAATLIPCLVVTMLGLVSRRDSRKMAFHWFGLVVGTGLIVALSKLVYLVWGVGIPGLNFIGLSGHSAMAAVTWPTLLSLLAGARRSWRIAAATLGVALALAICFSRWELGAHSSSEAVAGFMVGVSGAIVFLRCCGDAWRLPRESRWIIPVLFAAMFVMHGVRFPSQLILRSVAQYLSVDGVVHSHRPVNL